MYRFVSSIGFLLSFSVLSYGRHTVFISRNGAKAYLPTSSESNVCMTPTCVIAAANILNNLDETVDPCDDFYSFACGGWMKRHEVSEDQPELDLLTTTQIDVDRELRNLLESKYENSEPHFVKLMKDFYNTCVDLETRENQGSEPLNKLLRRLGGWPVVEGSQWDESTFDWVETLILLRKLGYDYKSMVNLDVHLDYLNKTANKLYLASPNMRKLSRANISLGLDDPDIAAYYKMMGNAAKLLGANESTSEKELLEALHFEMALTKIANEDEDKKSEQKTTNTIEELQKDLPQVPWLRIFNGLVLIDQVYENETFINRNFGFLVKFSDLITSTDKRVIANYMLWRTVLESKEYLSQEWKDIEEDKKDDRLSETGKKAKIPRGKICLRELEKKMDIGLTSYYIRNYFKGDNTSKDEAMTLLKYVLKEFFKILEHNDWMDEKTRERAEEKANAIKTYIGYPNEMLNDTFMMEMYKNLTITTNSYLENILSINKWETDKRFSELGKIPDMSEISKFYGLLEVNAFYSPVENSIAIPVGILHDAFYDKDRPKYINFGVIGYVIGHEITHGFDNDGRKFDKDGKMINWWEKESDEHFVKKVKCIIDQYDNYTMDGGQKVNGETTKNENIADNGGMKEAYLGYQSWIKDHGIEPLLPGLNYSQTQIFWLSAARIWCSKYTPERLKEFLILDPHSPGKFRIIGPMSNLPEFSTDFKCSPDAPMNRKYKCEVW